MTPLDLLAKGPQTAIALAEAMNSKPGTTQAQLRRLRHLGLADRTLQNRYTLWFVIADKKKAGEMVRAKLAQLTAIAREKELQRNKVRARERYAEFRAKLQAQESEAAEAWLYPKRRIVPASTCALPKGLGPASVFQLAEAA